MRSHNRAGSNRDDAYRQRPTQDALYNLHKSLGVLILFLLVLRLINRLAAGALAAEAEIEQWQKTVSSIVQTLLHALLLAMPIVGYLANSAYGASTPFFRLFELPMIIGKNEELATQLFTLHRWVGWTWRGEVEGTGEPVLLMWWKGGKFTGIFTYRGRIYTLRNMGGDLHAIVETEPDKLPPDHGPSASEKGSADLKDDPLVSRGEGAPMRTAKAPNDHANTKDEGSAGQASSASALAAGSGKVVPLSAAKRRQMATNKVTIDVMVLYTPKVAKKYLDIDTDLIALATPLQQRHWERQVAPRSSAGDQI